MTVLSARICCSERIWSRISRGKGVRGLVPGTPGARCCGSILTEVTRDVLTSSNKLWHHVWSVVNEGSLSETQHLGCLLWDDYWGILWGACSRIPGSQKESEGSPWSVLLRSCFWHSDPLMTQCWWGASQEPSLEAGWPSRTAVSALVCTWSYG